MFYFDKSGILPSCYFPIQPPPIFLLEQPFFKSFSKKVAKSKNVSPFLFSAPCIRLKKQLGISLRRRFLLIHGEQPLLCFVGCKGQLRLLQVQKLLKVFIIPPNLVEKRNNLTTRLLLLNTCFILSY